MPANAFVSLEQLQDGLEQPGRINCILVAGRTRDRAAGPEASQALASALHPTLDDLGLAVQHVQLAYTDPQTQQSETIYDYFSLSSQRMVLPPEVETAARRAFDRAGGQPVFTYLANRLEPVSDDPARLARVARSPTRPWPRLTSRRSSSCDRSKDEDSRHPDRTRSSSPTGPPANWGFPREMRSRLTFFEPETTHGTSVEKQQILTVAAITPLTPPSEPYLPSRQLQFAERPTVANDPGLTPEVKGITDQKSIDDWEVPFTIDYNLIRPEDDEYWEDYGTTPKAFVSLATGRRLWGSRFGHSTSYRIPAREGLTEDAVQSQLLEQLARAEERLGFDFQPIKRRQLLASAGNTPFDVLFLMLSFFIIAAALLLVALLFRLGFEQRARQAGLLLAVGWRPRRVRRLLVAEGLGISAVGSALGVLIGLGYAALILAALRSKSWWLGAVTTPFLEFHVTPRSLLIGGLAGVVVSGLTIAWSVFQTRHIPARRLLTGQLSVVGSWVARPARWPLVVAGLLLLAALALAVAAVSLSGQQQAGAFVGAGASMLAAILLGTWQALRSGGSRIAGITGRLPLLRLAVPQCGSQSGPQHADDRVDRHRQFLDRGDERFSAATHRDRHRRIHAGGRVIPADLQRSQQRIGTRRTARRSGRAAAPTSTSARCVFVRVTTPVVAICTERANRASWESRLHSSSVLTARVAGCSSSPSRPPPANRSVTIRGSFWPRPPLRSANRSPSSSTRKRPCTACNCTKALARNSRSTTTAVRLHSAW